jgi:hypothetical protein
MAWIPSPNPGGRNRELIIRAVAEWIMAQHVLGLDAVQCTPRGTDRVDWEADAVGTSGPRCVGILLVPRVSEDRVAGTGPVNPGGKLAHYETELELHYLSGEPDDWEAATFDFYRIVDALKDCLRGSGRDANRPDVVLQLGEYPREGSITDDLDDPVSADGGIYCTGTVSFTVSQYMQAQPAQ